MEDLYDVCCVKSITNFMASCDKCFMLLKIKAVFYKLWIHQKSKFMKLQNLTGWFWANKLIEIFHMNQQIYKIAWNSREIKY